MAQAMHQDTPQHTASTDMSVGEILRRTREHYKQSIQEVERNLRIRAEQIQAIEENDVAKLPAKVYAIGFVRSYSEYLGLDGDKMVERFKQQSANIAADPVLNFPVAALDSKAPPIWIVVACLVVLIAISGVWLNGHRTQREAIETIPPVPVELQASTKPASEPARAELSNEPFGPSAPQKAVAQAPKAPSQKGITLKMTDNSWVEIKDASGKTLISRVLESGDQYFVPDNANLTISLGNAGGVSISVDGVQLAPLGAHAQVIRNIPLDGTALKQRFAADIPLDPAVQ